MKLLHLLAAPRKLANRKYLCMDHWGKAQLESYPHACTAGEKKEIKMQDMFKPVFNYRQT